MVLPDTLVEKIISEAKALEQYVIGMRREFHQYPETGFEEFRTSQRIKEELSSVNVTPRGVAETGVCGLIQGCNSLPHCIALRADIDALCLTEENDCSYCSKNPGRMHACGHDAHAAMLLGAVKILSNHVSDIQGSVKCIFQPAEEGGGGGKKIADEGVLADVEAAIALHVWNTLDSGKFASRTGPFFASANKIKISIDGKGGHAAYPHTCIDPVAVSADIYNAVQKLVSREVSPFNPTVISLTRVCGSDAHNIIPEKVVLKGTMRNFDDTTMEYLIKRVEAITSLYAKAWRCNGTFCVEDISYPVLHNDASLVSECIPPAEKLGLYEETEQTLGGEDFAFYGHHCKTAMFLLGIGNKDKGIVYPHHHPRFDIDESVLWKGSAFLALAALQWLSKRNNKK